MKTEKEALQYLERIDGELSRVATEATAETDTVEAEVAKHETALASYRATNKGMVAAVNAKTFLASFDGLLWPAHTTPLGATAIAERQRVFTGHRQRLAHEARETFIRENVEALADAIDAIISSRSRGRDAWRTKTADSVQALERRELLGEKLSDAESRKLDTLATLLATADATHGSALSHVRKFRVTAKIEDFNDARMFASQISYDLQSSNRHPLA
jgi:hypothetical protein